MKIETSNPSGYQWHAMTDSYEPGMPLGVGATEAEAVADLKEQLAESEPCAGSCETLFNGPSPCAESCLARLPRRETIHLRAVPEEISEPEGIEGTGETCDEQD